MFAGRELVIKGPTRPERLVSIRLSAHTTLCQEAQFFRRRPYIPFSLDIVQHGGHGVRELARHVPVLIEHQAGAPRPSGLPRCHVHQQTQRIRQQRK